MITGSTLTHTYTLQIEYSTFIDVQLHRYQGTVFAMAAESLRLLFHGLQRRLAHCSYVVAAVSVVHLHLHLYPFPYLDLDRYRYTSSSALVDRTVVETALG
jgi:hypothetical protein